MHKKVFCAAVFAFSFFASFGCAAPYSPPKTVDLSQLSWTQAFDALHEKISKEYGFTHWKKINWAKKKKTFRPCIEEAERSGDQEAYYMALREYLFSIPDGHVLLRWLGLPLDDDNGLVENGLGTYERQVGGGFGFTIAHLDNGEIIANWVKKGGPAELAGMRAGAQILRWGGLSAKKALKKTSVIWSADATATKAGRDYERTRFMVRFVVGASKKVVFRNHKKGKAVHRLLTAVDDDMETLKRTNPFGRNWVAGVYPTSMIKSRLLRGKIGYIKIYAETDMAGQPPTLTLFREAVAAFKECGVRGLILDVRQNRGGEDAMGASLLGSFFKKRTFYEYQNWYNAASGKKEIIFSEGSTWVRGEALYIEPTSNRFTGPVVTLVNSGCISTGEGIPLYMRRLGKVVGFRGTNGSFGMVLQPMALMPGFYLVNYPIGQSLNRHRRVQVDSRKGRGGVVPTDRVPMTRKNALRVGAGRDVELSYAYKLIGS